MGELHLEVSVAQAAARPRRQGDGRQADGRLPPDAGQADRVRDALHQAVGRPRQVRRHLHASSSRSPRSRSRSGRRAGGGGREAGPEQHLLRRRDLRRRGADASTSRRSRQGFRDGCVRRGPSTASRAWTCKATLLRRQVPRRRQLGGHVQAGGRSSASATPRPRPGIDAAGADHERGGASPRSSTRATWPATSTAAAARS